MKKIINDEKGFTMIEVVVVISIMLIIMGIVISSGRTLNDTINLKNTTKGINTKIKLAKSRSISALNGTNYGIYFKPSRVVIFKGDTFVDGNPSNEVYTFSNKIKISNINLVSPPGTGSDVVFNRLIGSTLNVGTVEVQVISDPSKTRQIVINSDGQTSFGAFQTSTNSIIKNARHVHFNLGWKIESSTVLSLKWVDDFGVERAKTDIDISTYFDDVNDIFDWTGTTLVDGVSQEIRIHSWPDGSLNTVLCLIREQTEEQKLQIFTDAGAKNIATYENVGAGIVNVNAEFDGGIMEIQ
ncbi:MAG: type II secretion system protein [Patescibacteria group bacterium]|nr:type II secretion system protein [Patescibacteria group bacterium]